MKRKIGTWIYQNSGGTKIEERLIASLREREIETITGLNLRQAIVDPSGMYCHGTRMEDLDLFFSYNAGEQTVYQTYLYEELDRHIPIINNYKAFALTEDKFKTARVMRANDIATAEFFLCYRDEPHRVHDILGKWGKMVFKPVDGWGGVGMVLIDKPEVLDAVLPFLHQTNFRFFYVEKFIDYDGSDYRVDVVDGEVVGCYGRKVKEGGWKTNITSGGSVILREINQEIEELALRAAKVSGLEIAGVDIIYDREHEKYIVLEINGIPAFATPDQEKMGLDFNDRKIQKIVDLIDRKTQEKRA